jgi:hypothetical protein
VVLLVVLEPEELLLSFVAGLSPDDFSLLPDVESLLSEDDEVVAAVLEPLPERLSVR